MNSQTGGRRRFLKGLGVAMGLPALEALDRRGVSAGDVAQPPKRAAFIYVPNGAQQQAWFPQGRDADFEFSSTMQPLRELRDHIQIFAGLDHQHAESGPDGAGDHARANATFLTGMRARKTSGSNIRVGQSIDQAIAEHIGHQTKFASLELTCDAIRRSGRCDSGYSCAYQYNISWKSPVTPMSPEPNPRNVFERLFGDAAPGSKDARVRRRAQQRSVLDFVLDDASQLKRGLSVADRHQLDEYMAGVREVERRIERLESFPQPKLSDFEKIQSAIPEDVPEDHAEHIDIMLELMAIAFESDTTRVATLLMAHDGSNRAFPELGIREGHHYLTHNQEKQDVREKVARIDRFYMQRFAKFLTRLRGAGTPDGSSLLDHSLIVYGSGIADADDHTHDNLPVVLAGSGGGTLSGGRYVQVPSQPMSNLFLSIADRMGVPQLPRFGDSTGRLADV